MTGTGDGKLRDDSPFSTGAIISYMLIVTFWLISFSVFTLLWSDKTVDSAMLTVLGSIVTCAVAGVGAVGGFWLAGAIGSRANQEALRKLAGADGVVPAPAPNATDAASTTTEVAS